MQDETTNSVHFPNHYLHEECLQKTDGDLSEEDSKITGVGLASNTTLTKKCCLHHTQI